MIVCKFGGSCTANADAIANIKRIRRNPTRKVFVFSAIGKDYPCDTKMTDLLLSLADQQPNSNQYNKTRAQIINKFQTLVKMTGVDFDIYNPFENVEKTFLQTHDKEFLVSRGEYFTTLIMSKYLDLEFVPAEEVIFFNGSHIDERKSRVRLEHFLENNHKLAIPGFYGMDEFNKIRLFSRGGGDYSGALIAKLIDANCYENWTDVDGIFEVNPNILKSNIIKNMSYSQLEVMTSMDANVIHKDCAKLLSKTKAKLKIRSCFSLSTNFTSVDNRPHPNTQFICYQVSSETAQILVQNRNSTKVVTTKSENLHKQIASEYSKLKQ